MVMKIKQLYSDAIIPTRGSEEAAGWDLYAHLPQESIEIPPRSAVMIDTGIALEIPKGNFGGIYARSGLACKRGLRPANCVGVIDSDYRGEVKVCLHNDSNDWQKIYNKERIAQLVIQPYTTITLEEVEDLDNTDRGDGGFGSTGTK